MKNKLKSILAFSLFAAMGAFAQNGNVGIGTTSPQGALDISSTTNGLLIPRMDSAQRDAIGSPANALLIFNTSNNSFEVFKHTCYCWVAVTDGGNTPAQNLVNTAPTASTLNYTGKAIVGVSFTVKYIYSDAQNDLEGLTGIQWQSATSSTGASATNISGATSASYTPILSNAGQWIRAVVTPRAETGILNGIQTFGSWVQVESSTIPTANSLYVYGTVAQGSTLTARYTFAGGSGVEDTDPSTGTLYTWQTATTNTGVGIATEQTSSNNAFVPQSNVIGRFVRVGVRAKDNAGLQAINSVFSPWVGPITLADDAAPVVSNLNISPAPSVGTPITASYTYFDVNFDPEDLSGSGYQWYRADDANGTNQVAISGANDLTYTPVLADGTKFLGIGVTPFALTGFPLAGTQVIHYNTNAVLPQATFTFTSNPIQQLPFFAINRAMDAQNSIQVEINVSSTGGIVFSSNTVNGYSFSGSFTASTTGNQWVTLTATGTQSAYNSAGDNFTITGVGSSTQTKSITIYNSITGNGLTSFSNGGSLNETFNNNGTCQNAIISAGYNTSSCTGSVTVGSNTYNLVHIQGQCWMESNIKQAPTAPCVDAINTGCNTWLATNTGDLGYWGYYNVATTAGTSGWATSEPATGEGLLYQWSAAMNGSTVERAKGVCPAGFHIPSDCEWMYLEHGQGMAIAQQNNTGNRSSTSEGNKLRSAGTGATNTSGFSGLLTGNRNTNGSFTNRATTGFYWTSTASGTNALNRRLTGSSAFVNRSSSSPASGFSVRCIKD